MADRVCPKCGSVVKVERSAIRLTLRCTQPGCKWATVKIMLEKGRG